MNLEEKKYDAFISYRHADLDQYVAITLHRELEAFRVPHNMVKQLQKLGISKRKINRVFRDRDELPITNNLADPITNALKNSEYLLVICSPRLKESIWCQKEIETFIGMHGREHVFAVLAEGEPEQSFPQALLFDGDLPVEPLAADVRGKNRKEIRKKIREEVVRLAAPMFSCGYDDLKQRHREQKMKRALALSIVISGIFLTFGAISTTMAIQIGQQSKQIVQQNEEIEKQYHEALINQSKNMSDTALRQLEEGDRIQAVQTAATALTGEEGIEMPVTSEAQYALAESLYVYQNDALILPDYMLKHDAQVAAVKMSPQKERLLSVDNYGAIYVWDIAAKKCIAQINTQEYVSSFEEETYAFIDENKIIYPIGNGYSIYDISTGATVKSEEGSLYATGVSKEGTYFVTVLDSNVVIFDSENLNQIAKYEIPEGRKSSGTFAFDEERKLVAFGVEPEYEGEDRTTQVLLMDLQGGNITGEYEVHFSDIDKLDFSGTTLYAIVNETLYDNNQNTNLDFMIPLDSCLYSFDTLVPGKMNWCYTEEGNRIKNFMVSDLEGSTNMIISLYSNVKQLDIPSGRLLESHEFGQEIVELAKYANKDNFLAVTRSGELYMLKADDPEEYQNTSFCCNSTNVEHFLISDAGFLVVPYGEPNITVLNVAVGNDVQELLSVESSIANIGVSKDEKRLLVECYGNGSEYINYLVDADTKEIIATIKDKEVTQAQSFLDIDEQYFALVQGKTLKLYSSQDGSEVSQYELPYFSSVVFSQDGQSLFLFDASHIIVMDVISGEEIYNMDQTEDMSALSVAAVGNTMHTYAIASKNDRVLKIFKTGEETEYAQIDIKAAFVKELFYDDLDQYLFVVYMDGKVEVYQMSDLTLIQTFSGWEYTVSEYLKFNEEGFILKGISGGYLINKNMETIARIPSVKNMVAGKKEFITTNSKTVYEVPYYDVDMLLGESEEYLE